MAVQFGDSPLFQRLTSLSSSGSKSKHCWCLGLAYSSGLKMEMILEDDTSQNIGVREASQRTGAIKHRIIGEDPCYWRP
jgi:hypothetical protein